MVRSQRKRRNDEKLEKKKRERKRETKKDRQREREKERERERERETERERQRERVRNNFDKESVDNFSIILWTSLIIIPSPLSFVPDPTQGNY